MFYRDFNLKFINHPQTKELSVLEDGEAVKQSVKNLVFTNYAERFQNHYLASNVTAYLFDGIDSITACHIRQEIERVITNFEPRAKLNGVKVVAKYGDNGFEVDISFNLIGLTTPITVNFFLKRIR